MTEEELKKKCKERAKIFQQAMEGCKSSNPMDCIEWFADKITELEAQIEKMKCCENCKYYNNHYNEVVCKRQVINCKRILRQATRDQWEIKEK